MKKLLLITGDSRESVQANGIFLHTLFANIDDITVFSPQEVGALLEASETPEGTIIPYEVSYHTLIKNFYNLRHTIEEQHCGKGISVFIAYGNVDRRMLPWFDTVITAGYKYTRKDKTEGKRLPTPEIEDVLKTGVQPTTGTDGAAAFFMKRELQYFLEKWVKNARKEAEAKNEI